MRRNVKCSTTEKHRGPIAIGMHTEIHRGISQVTKIQACLPTRQARSSKPAARSFCIQAAESNC
jgi:hypothetical protein